jgi:hypothetical protein
MKLLLEFTTIHFLIPGLFQPLELWRKDFAFQPVAENLLRLCANTSVETSPVQGLENTLFHQCGYPADTEIPFAYYRYLWDFGVPPPQPLLCADPVFLQSGLDSVVLQPELPQIPAHELATLLGLLNQHLAEDGLQLVAKHPQRWYLLGERVHGDTPLRTVPLSQVMGQSIFPLLPQGDKRYWHRLLNETQMLLHTSATNSVNALWLWGAANPSSLPPLQQGGRGGFLGSTPTAQVMALATNTLHQPATKLSDCRLEAGNHAIILEDLHIPSVSDDMQNWQQAIEAMEANWFAPALEGMKSGKFSVSLSACDGRTLHCLPSPAWKFWQTRSISWQQLTGCG